MEIWQYFALFHLIWGAGISLWLYRLLNGGLDYILKEDQEYAKKFGPFRRTDIPKWNRFELYIGATFLFPYRILFAVIFAVTCGTTCSLITLGVDLKKELDPARRFTIRVLTYIFPRIILICLGFYIIEKKYHRITDLDPTYPKDQEFKNPIREAPIVVSNHISFIDIVYFLTSRYCPAFLSKAGVAKVPFVGTVAKARQCIFVNRADRTQKDAVLEDIKYRVAEQTAGKFFPPVLVFPEGTTAEGKSILTFKKGAFFTLAPVRIIALEYPKETFSPAYDNLDLPVIMVVLLSQFYNRLRVHDCGIYDPSHLDLKVESDWVRYADKVRAIICKSIGATPYEIGLQEKTEYYKYGSELKKKLRGGAKNEKKIE